MTRPSSLAAKRHAKAFRRMVEAFKKLGREVPLDIEHTLAWLERGAPEGEDMT